MTTLSAEVDEAVRLRDAARLDTEWERKIYQAGMVREVVSSHVDLIVRLAKELAAAMADYDGVVTKFDNCRAALASRYKADTGNEPNPPDEYEGDWHEWLIEQSEKAAIKP